MAFVWAPTPKHEETSMDKSKVGEMIWLPSAVVMQSLQAFRIYVCWSPQAPSSLPVTSLFSSQLAPQKWSALKNFTQNPTFLANQVCTG